MSRLALREEPPIDGKFEIVRTQLGLHRQQLKALRTHATEILYGGAAGGGKSHLIRVMFIYYCCLIPGLICGIFRRLFGDLIQNHMQGPSSFPALLGPLVDSGHVAIVRSQIRFWNGSLINLLQCQYEHTVYKYQGSEFHLLGFDELTHFTAKMYKYLRGRCRVSGIKVPEGMTFPKIIAGTNPGNIGHHWVKADFVDHGLEPWQTPLLEGSMIRQFIPAKATDNPRLLKDDPTYLIRLEGLGDPMLVRAMKDGDWNVVPGSVFGAVWRIDRHIRAAFPIPEGWEIWRGSDDGFASPAACYWLTQNPDTKTIYVIAELYAAGMRPQLFAERIKRIDREIVRVRPLPECPEQEEEYLNEENLDGSMDSGAFTDVGTGSDNIARGNELNRYGCRFKPVEKFPGSRVMRVQSLLNLLDVNPKDPKGGPGIVFFNNCPNAIRTIPALPRDPNKIEDIDTDAEDHAFDGVTYGVQHKKPNFRRKKVKGA